MISKAITRYIRISPRKTRLVADMIRNKSIDEAKNILMNLEKRARLYVQEVLNSAVANAARNPEISPADLYVSKITVDGGPMFKRYRAGSMGRAMMIRHRTSHILVELDLKKEVVKKRATQAAQKVSAAKKRTTTDERRTTKHVTKKAVAAKRGK